MNADFRGGIHADVAIPHALCDSNPAFHDTVICVWGWIARLPDGACTNDLTFHSARGVLINAVAQVQRAHFQPRSQLVDGLFQRKSSLRMAGSAEGRAR